MSSGRMSRRRAFSASDGNRNRDNISRDASVNTPEIASQSKSTRGNSPPRIFIKPKEGASSQTSVNTADKPAPAPARRASLIAVPTNQRQQRSTRRACSLTSAKPVHAPRRSTSLHHAALNSVNSANTPASKLPRSTTLMMRHAPAKPVANRGVDGDVGHSIQSSVCHKKDKPAAIGVARAPSTSSAKKDKENDPSAAAVLLPDKTSGKRSQLMPKRTTFTRKQSPLVPDELKQDGSPPRRAFLLPKVDDSVAKPPVPRRSSSRPGPPRSEKKDELLMKKKAGAPSLPTIIMKHTPPRMRLAQALFNESLPPVESGATQTEATVPASKHKSKSRPFLLPRRVGSLASLTSFNSIFSLPSQVLKHTPLGSQSSDSPSSSPCLSKARTKTIWTMLDEMKLIRSGGLLQDTDGLAPGRELRVVPLCQRLLNGSDASDSPGSGIARRTPVRSSSTPYKLDVSSARRARFEATNALPPVPSITSALAHTKTEWEHHVAEDRPKTTTDDGEKKYKWTLVHVKKPASECPERQSPLGKPMISAGYGVSITTRDTTTASKPSLLTRAHTLVKFKFSGSKRVVGRGDPMWT